MKVVGKFPSFFQKVKFRSQTLSREKDMLVLLHSGFSEDSRKIQNAYYLVVTTYVIPYLIRWYKFQHAITLKIKYLGHMRLILCIW